MTEQAQLRERIEPRPDRPDMEGYGIATDPEGMLLWGWASAALAAARNYWIGTTRPDGRPHAAPVWGIWLDETFYFGTGPTSCKGRNLAVNPAIVVHLESGDDSVILEGVAEPLTDASLLERYADAYEAKYQFRPDTSKPEGTYMLRPRVAFGWRERDFPTSATRWRFREDAGASTARTSGYG